jgi:hypothetical protein
MISCPNVKDFGAVGDGSTDDTAAIQAAVNDTTSPKSSANRGVILFPPGSYKLTASVDFEAADSVRNIAFVGMPGAKLIGSVNGALLKRSVNTPLSAVCSIENLIIENTHATGKCIMFHSLVGGKIVNCSLSGFIGIETYGSQSVSVDSCSIIRGGSNNLASSVGIVAGNGTTVISTDITSFANGIRHQNVGLTVLGGRLEVNSIGILLGVDETGSTFQSTGVFISGLSMEANVIAIKVQAGAGVVIQGLSEGAGGGVVVSHGIYIVDGNDIFLSGVVMSAADGFTTAGIKVDGCTRLVMQAVSSPSWSIAGGVTAATFTQTNKP